MKMIMIASVLIIVVIVTVVKLLPNKRSFMVSEIIKAPLDMVFSKVVTIKSQKWRRDVGEIEIIDEQTWIEKFQNGQNIKFKIKNKVNNELFEIEIIDNPHFSGYWTGSFKKIGEFQTEVKFEENVKLNGFFPKIMSYIFFDIEKTVKNYVEDLKRSVEKEHQN